MTDIACLAFASAYCVIEVATVKVLLASSYVVVIPVPSYINAFTLSSTLSFVKYKLEEPSDNASVFARTEPPNEVAEPPIVILEFANIDSFSSHVEIT